MNTLLISCLLCLVCSAGCFSTHDPPTGVSGDLQISSEYEEAERRQAAAEVTLVQHLPRSGGGGGGGGGGGKVRRRERDRKKNKKGLNTTHTPTQRHHTHSHTTAEEDLCTTTYKDYCVHGHCQFIPDLPEPSCVCQRGYEGKRCAVQLMKTEQKEEHLTDADSTHIALLVVAVVLSVISCSALLLTICVHYKTQRRFQSAFLGSSSEKENLQKSDAIVVQR
ncbi:proheparin-binding EGF-like growth factor isoform X2 [Denticeps clupeoides]|uniref:proheparin-binding EGF-like growth factor isoform X2 n=1 Tax=Denticeps clupeoides TaxID=299321 RepID=UPI0010A4799F|nr:proheparin-binding EGF-like growth factor isoform X2 [Denticeps clupeoides]